MDAIEKKLLEEVADLHGIPEGAYNIRADGKLAGRNTTAHINIVTKEDKPGIDIYIAPARKTRACTSRSSFPRPASRTWSTMTFTSVRTAT